MATYSKFLNYGLPYVKFGSYESYKNLGMILTSYDLGIPKRKTIIISTLLTQGNLDVTDNVISTPTYESRTIKLDFEVNEPRKNFNTIRNDVLRLLHGKMMDVNIIDETANVNVTYEGRVSIDRFKTDKRRGVVAISVDAKPFQKGTTTL